jgi:hypothetical protein
MRERFSCASWTRARSSRRLSSSEHDVAGEQPGLFEAQPFQFRAQLPGARAQLAGLGFDARHGDALGTAPLLETGHLDAQHRMILAGPGRAGPEALQLLERGLERALLPAPVAFLLFRGGLIGLALGQRAPPLAADALQLQPGHGQARGGARELLDELAHLVVERHRFLFLLLLRAAEALELLFEYGQTPLQRVDARGQLIQLSLARLHQRPGLAQLALEGQRAAGALLAAAHRLAVVADAVRQQEVEGGVLDGQPLGGGAVLDQESPRQERQALQRGAAEAVGEPQHLGQPGDDVRFRAELRAGGALRGGRLGMNQKRGPALDAGAHQLDAALGLGPVLDDDVLQLVVEELLGGLLVGRLDLDEIRQHAQRLQPIGLPALDGREKALHRLGGVGAVREDLLERIAAGFAAGKLGARLLQREARGPQGGLAVGELLFDAAALVGDRLQLHLPLGQLRREVLPGGVEPLEVGSGRLLLFLRLGGVALERGQAGIRLRDLIPEAGGLA